MTSRRDIKRRLEELEASMASEDDEESIELTPKAQEAMREILRYRRELTHETGEHVEMTEEILREALTAMDPELAEALIEATRWE